MDVSRANLGHFDKDTASISRLLSLGIILFDPKVTGNLVTRLSLKVCPSEPVRFEQGIFQFGVEELPHCATPPCCKFALYNVNCVLWFSAVSVVEDETPLVLNSSSPLCPVLVLRNVSSLASAASSYY